MSSIVIKGNTSGQVEIAAPAVAGSTTLTLPTGSGNIIKDDGSGNVTLSGNITPSGIYLGGTTSSHLLNDYETGTWTPIMRGGTVTGTWTPDASSGGFYVKVGKLVTIFGNVRGTVSGASGVAQVTGLPFVRAPGVAANGNNATYSSMPIGYWLGISVDASGFLIHPTTYLYAHTRTDTSSSGGPISITNVTHNLHFSGSYFTDS